VDENLKPDTLEALRLDTPHGARETPLAGAGLRIAGKNDEVLVLCHDA
jgi:hypothetical protein